MATLTKKSALQRMLEKEDADLRAEMLAGENIIDHPDGGFLWKKNPRGAVVKMSPDAWLEIRNDKIRFSDGWVDPTPEEIEAWQRKNAPGEIRPRRGRPPKSLMDTPEE